MFRWPRSKPPEPETTAPTAVDALDMHLQFLEELNPADASRIYADTQALYQAGIRDDLEIGLALVAVALRKRDAISDVADGLDRLCDRVSSLIDAVRDRP